MACKMIYLARRNPALSAAAFPQAWREHAALGAGCANVRERVVGVTQCSRDLAHSAALAGATADYDGVNLLVLKDRQAADDIWSDEATLRIMRPDEPRVFSTYVRNFTLVADEVVLHAGAAGDGVVVAFLRLRPQTDPAALAGVLAATAAARWRADPALGAAQRLVLNRVDGAPPPGYEYALIVEAWYPDPAAAAAAFGSTRLAECLPAALAACIDADASVVMLAHVTHRRS